MHSTTSLLQVNMIPKPGLIGESQPVLAVRNMPLLERLEPLIECPGLGICSSRENCYLVCMLQIPPQQGPFCFVPQPYSAGDGFILCHTHVSLYQDGSGGGSVAWWAACVDWSCLAEQEGDDAPPVAVLF